MYTQESTLCGVDWQSVEYSKPEIYIPISNYAVKHGKKMFINHSDTECYRSCETSKKI